MRPLPTTGPRRSEPSACLRVLLVDDEESLRGAIARFFGRRGWDVREAGDGESARNLLAPNSALAFDLVICDLRMPRFSGCDLYRWLERCRPEVVERFVFTSGDLLSPESAAFLRAAGRPVLPKPFDLCELDRIIDQIAGTAHVA